MSVFMCMCVTVCVYAHLLEITFILDHWFWYFRNGQGSLSALVEIEHFTFVLIAIVWSISSKSKFLFERPQWDSLETANISEPSTLFDQKSISDDRYWLFTLWKEAESNFLSCVSSFSSSSPFLSSFYFLNFFYRRRY